MTDQEYRLLKREVDEAQAAAQRARGALEQTIAVLKKDFGCENLKEAKAKLKQLEKKRDDAKEAFDKAAEDYKKEWHGSED